MTYISLSSLKFSLMKYACSYLAIKHLGFVSLVWEFSLEETHQLQAWVAYLFSRGLQILQFTSMCFQQLFKKLGYVPKFQTQEIPLVPVELLLLWISKTRWMRDVFKYPASMELDSTVNKHAECYWHTWANHCAQQFLHY